MCQFLQAKLSCLMICALFSGYKLIGSHSGVKLCRWTKVCCVSFSDFINKNKARDLLRYSNFLMKLHFKMCYYLHKPKFHLSSYNLAFPAIKIPLQRVRIELWHRAGNILFWFFLLFCCLLKHLLPTEIHVREEWEGCIPGVRLWNRDSTATAPPEQAHGAA